jgi:hypothetical protein
MELCCDRVGALIGVNCWDVFRFVLRLSHSRILIVDNMYTTVILGVGASFGLEVAVRSQLQAAFDLPRSKLEA